jgi:uncharacterized phage-associated protein
MPAAVNSAFDIAFWFADMGCESNDYLQPQRLQHLLFLAQAYFAALHNGRKLMPACFVADELGPTEPNVYVAFSRGRPNVDASLFLPDEVIAVLRGIWRRFGHHSAERLASLVKETAAYRDAFHRGPRAEISLEAMRRSVARGDKSPSPTQIVRPKLMRTQDGRPVVVKAWAPGARTAIGG